MEVEDTKLAKRIKGYRTFVLIFLNLVFLILTIFYAFLLGDNIYIGINENLLETHYGDFIISITTLSISLISIIVGWITSVWAFNLMCSWLIEVQNNISSMEKSTYESRRYLSSIVGNGNSTSIAIRYKTYTISETIAILDYAINNYSDPIRAIDYLQLKNNEVEGKDPYITEVVYALKSGGPNQVFDSLERYKAQLINQTKNK